MKPREPRHKVLIGARMRLDGSFRDVRIRDISTKGLMLEAEGAPQRGSYLEIRRGPHIIVARVVWSRGSRFGVLARERMNIAAIVNEPDRSGARPIDAATQMPAERRSSPRPSARRIGERAVRNRYLSAAFQFGSIVAFGAAVSLMLFGIVQESLAGPMKKVVESVARN